MTSPNSTNTSIMRRSFKRGKKLFTRFSVDHSHTSNASVEGSWDLSEKLHFPRFFISFYAILGMTVMGMTVCTS